MKNKSTSDPFETCSWAMEAITTPRQVIAHCFSTEDIGSFRRSIRQVLLSAASAKVHRKNDPSTIWRQFKMITSVVMAARQMHPPKQKDALQVTEEQFLDSRLYAKPYSACPEWDYLPRTLNAAEYKNPFLVLKRFFKTHDVAQWKTTIDDVLDYAFARYTDQCDLNLLQLFLQLTKLMEAAHLIDVREITHISGRLKPGIVLQKAP